MNEYSNAIVLAVHISASGVIDILAKCKRYWHSNDTCKLKAERLVLV